MHLRWSSIAALAICAALSLTPVHGQAETAAVLMNDQDSNGADVRVASVTMSNGGFVVLHNESLLDGDAVGSVVGFSSVLGAGTHVAIDVPVMGLPDGEQTLIAMPHMDTNGNGEYDFVTSNGTEDGPYTTAGSAVTDSATVDVQPATAEVSFEDQTRSGGKVTVASATLSRGGFVVIHDETLKDGDALGSVVGTSEYLAPGDHTGIEISVSGVSGTQTLIAMPHLDSNGNQTYDFVTSGGSADGPYTDEDGAITDTATTRARAADTTTTPADGEDEDSPALPLLLAAGLLLAFAARRRR